ncbi:hypothetical protein [Bifidobacterium vespertilionis]|uniref:hypothetical protein n=1 Tax=Bifidobacterium vespertilionis TaxID=2562524 RepID=UPI001BDBF8B0|nr:hypothetical protein [Bifidobacterium vespertilionis]MBT1179116.1 hypothetical protein [Bifidobacterium vespertilionis]
MAPDASGALGLGARMRRLRAFWLEPHFLAKTRVIAIVLWVGALLVFQPSTALDMLAVFTLFAVIAVLPVMPRVVVPIGLMIALIVGFVPGDAVELATVITLYALFLTAGFACDGRLCALMVALYAMAEVTCAMVWGSSSAALEVINGLVDAWSNMFADNMIVGGGADIPDLMAWAFAVAMSMLLSGFAAVFGHSFRISAVAGGAAGAQRGDGGPHGTRTAAGAYDPRFGGQRHVRDRDARVACEGGVGRVCRGFRGC